jgi:hypothetical protein
MLALFFQLWPLTNVSRIETLKRVSNLQFIKLGVLMIMRILFCLLFFPVASIACPIENGSVILRSHHQNIRLKNDSVAGGICRIFLNDRLRPSSLIKQDPATLWVPLGSSGIFLSGKQSDEYYFKCGGRGNVLIRSLKSASQCLSLR